MSTKDVQLPIKLMPLATQKARFKVAYGGRGSAKSESIARILLLYSLKENCRILCCREYQKSIRDSVHALLRSIIMIHSWNDYFEITQHSILCKLTGAEFIFCGLAEHTVDSVKSLFGFKYVWIEEAQTISKRSLDLLIPTIRVEGSEFFITFNPSLETDPVYDRWVANPDKSEDSIVVEINYDDNPWFPDVLKKEMEASKRRSLEDYLHIWKGKTVSFTKASILGHLIKVEAFEPEANWVPRYGIDWGFAADPTVCTRSFVNKNKLYLRNEFHGYGIEINDYATCFRVVPGAHKHELKADNSRPESISYLNNPQNYPDKKPLRVVGAPKWSGSVEDGISWLRALDAIIIHPECTASIYEMPRYSWKVDKMTDKILPVPVDANNHVVDSLRYGCCDLIKKKVSLFDAM